MEYTAIAEWLNTTFAGYDSAILDFMNTLAGKAGVVLTPLMKAITFLGEKGIVFFLLALAFMCFSRTRREGVCMFGAVCCGALITNIILKDMVARPRPFEYMALYKSFWDFVGSPAESGFSFPSGHVTATAAGMTSLCFTKGKKFIAPTVVVVLLMAMSRNYLMAHFPSDVLFAAIIGVFSGFIAYLITRAIFIYLDDNDDFPFCAFVLNFDLPVRLPDKAALAGVINNFGRGSGKSSRTSGASRRAQAARRDMVDDVDEDEGAFSDAMHMAENAADELLGEGERPTRRSARTGSAAPRRAQAAARSKAASEDEGAFSGALRFATSAGRSLIGKRTAAEDTEENATPSHRKSSPSDWSNRWESYRSSRDSASQPEARTPSKYEQQLMKFSAPAPASQPVELDDEDADMKIAPAPVKKKPALLDFDAPAAPVSAAQEAPRKAEKLRVAEDIPATTGTVEISDDGIDWASLGLSELADSNYGLDDEAEAVPRRRSSRRRDR